MGGDSARGNQFLGFRRPSRKKEEEEEEGKEKGKKGSAIWKSRGQWTLSGPVEGEIDLENHLVVRSWAREGATQFHGHGFPYTRVERVTRSRGK